MHLSRALASLVLLGAATTLFADAPKLEWHDDFDEAVQAAEKSGRPLLAVTLWREGVCNSCDTWRTRVPVEADVRRMFTRYERLRWEYDGLHGKVIPWTLENGGTSKDPSAQAFVIGRDGKVIARAPDSVAYTPTRFAEWLETEFLEYDDAHPRYRAGFRFGRLTASSGDTTDGATLALSDDRPTLLFVERTALPDDDRAHTQQSRAATKYATKVLDSKKLTAAVAGVDCVRLDLADAEHARVARALGIDAAPALLFLAPGAEPESLDVKASASSTAYRVKKLVADTASGE